MKKSRKIENIKLFEKDIIESVSYNVETAKNYLDENGVDYERFINKGLKQIEKSIKKKEKEGSKGLFFKRVVLAAEIVNNLYKERTFGHVKFQKLMYLCEQVSNMELSTRYVKQAAGPYDSRFMHTIDKEFKRLNWFNIDIKQENGFKTYEYSLGKNIDSYKLYFNNYYKDSISGITWLIDTFKTPQTKKVELVATIYYCLDEFLKNNKDFSNELLVEKVFSWSIEKKKKFTTEDITKAHNWMIENKLIPKKNYN